MPDPDAQSRTAAATLAAAKAKKRRYQRRIAGELQAAGWNVFPPETDPVPTDPGTYVSDNLWRHEAIRAAGPAAIGLWSYCLGHPDRTVVDGVINIPRETVADLKIGGVADVLIACDLWGYSADSDTFTYLHPGSLYTYVEADQ